MSENYAHPMCGFVSSTIGYQAIMGSAHVSENNHNLLQHHLSIHYTNNEILLHNYIESEWHEWGHTHTMIAR